MNILIADDHPLYREALGSMLMELDSNVNILEAETFQEVESYTDNIEVQIDLILLDLYMSDGDWKQVISDIRNTRPDTPLIVISSSESQEDANLVMESGAHGYIPKSLGKDEILHAIQLMISKEISIRPRISTPIKVSDINQAINYLTPRQREVLIEIGAGKSNKIIARELNMTEGTVKLHVAAILKTLGVQNRTQAALIATQINLSKKLHD